MVVLYQWLINKVEKSQYDVGGNTDPETVYVCELTVEGAPTTTSTSVRYKDLEILMEFFKVDSLSGLAGKSFNTNYDDARVGLRKIIQGIRVANDQLNIFDIYSIAVKSLARFEIPEFLGIRPRKVALAFDEAFDGFTIEPALLNLFMKEVKSISNGKVSLIKASPKEFINKYPQPYELLKLISAGREIKLVFTPSYPPIYIGA